MQTPKFDGPRANSFSYPYASSLRNSQVFVTRRAFRSFDRHPLESCELKRERKRSAPFALVVSPSAQHAILSSQGSNELFDKSRGCALSGDSGDPVALEDEAFLGGMALTWTGAPVDEIGVTRDAIARRLDGPRFAAVTANPPDGKRGYYAWDIAIRAGSRFRGVKAPELHFRLAGRRGVAAIGADFTIVVALDNGLLQVWPPVADARERAMLGAERNVGITAKWLSIIGQHIMLIAPADAGSQLQVFTGDTTPVYSLVVPFEVLQPAVAGRGGRIYLVGKGITAIDDRKVMWTHPSDDPIYASTFEDGSLALATGTRLDFVKPDGTVDQTFHAEEALVAPPAIAGDGSVWAASATALYIAR